MSNMQSLMRTVVISALCCGMMSSAFALEAGVVDIEMIMQSPKMRAQSAQLESKAEQYQAKLDTLKQEFDSLRSEFEKNDMLMDDATRQSKQSQLQKKAKMVENEKNNLSALLVKEQKQMLAGFQDIVAQFAQSEKIDLLFASTGLLYANPKLDKTQALLKMVKKIN